MTPSNPKPGEGHTPTPWTIYVNGASKEGLVYCVPIYSGGAYVATGRGMTMLVAIENADFIATAVNAHARLLASNAEMREALEPFAGIAVEYWPMGKEYADISMKRSLILAARAALARHPEKEGV